ncbi:MAG: hypothetical protein GY915_05415 [bacterium]|nr:hypothetical protein [bacterium]
MKKYIGMIFAASLLQWGYVQASSLEDGPLGTGSDSFRAVPPTEFWNSNVNISTNRGAANRDVFPLQEEMRNSTRDIERQLGIVPPEENSNDSKENRRYQHESTKKKQYKNFRNTKKQKKVLPRRSNKRGNYTQGKRGKGFRSSSY